MYIEYILTILSFILLIWIVIDIFILFPKRAIKWWNSISHYGQSVLMSKIGIHKKEDLKKSDIYELYRDHVRQTRTIN